MYIRLVVTTKQRQLACRALFDCHFDEKMIEEIKDSANACLVLGNERFKDEIEAVLKRLVRQKIMGGRREKLQSDPGFP